MKFLNLTSRQHKLSHTSLAALWKRSGKVGYGARETFMKGCRGPSPRAVRVPIRNPPRIKITRYHYGRRTTEIVKRLFNVMSLFNSILDSSEDVDKQLLLL